MIKKEHANGLSYFTHYFVCNYVSYQCTKHRLKLKKTYYHIGKIKLTRDIRLREVDTKNRKCNYFDHIISNIDFDLDNISQDKESYKNILIYHAA